MLQQPPSSSSAATVMRDVGAGLINLGNTCYISAVLQALAHSPELYIAMECETHSQTCPSRNKTIQFVESTSDGVEVSSSSSSSSSSTTTTGIPFCILCELENHLCRVYTPSNANSSNNNNNNNASSSVDTTPSPTLEAVSPLTFVKGFMTHVAPWFRIGLQEDSHEFLRLLIDAMQSSCISSRSKMIHNESVSKDYQESETEQYHQEDIINNIKKRKMESETSDHTSTHHIDDKEKNNQEYPFRLFRGTIESTVTCSSCHAVNRTFDPMEDLGLEVTFPPPMKKIPTVSILKGSHKSIHHHQPHHRLLGDVTSSLQKFIDIESLDSGYTCETCGVSGQATKQSKLASIPPILTLHLKRFRYGTGKNGIIQSSVSQGRNGSMNNNNNNNNNNGGSSSSSYNNNNHKSISSSIIHGYSQPSHDNNNNNNNQHTTSNHLNGITGSGKIEGFIRFEQVLDVRPYLTPSNTQKQTFCRLFAIIVHIGKNCHSGHYIAYVRHMNKNEWYRMDDTKVIKVTKEEVDSAEAYMLFYRVVDHPLIKEWKRKSDEKKQREECLMMDKKQEEVVIQQNISTDVVEMSSSAMEKDFIMEKEQEKMEIALPQDSSSVDRVQSVVLDTSTSKNYLENKERFQPKYKCIDDWEKKNANVLVPGMKNFALQLFDASSCVSDQVIDSMLRHEYMDYLKTVVINPSSENSKETINISIYDIDYQELWESARYAFYDLFMELRRLNEASFMDSTGNDFKYQLEGEYRRHGEAANNLYHKDLEKQHMKEEEIHLDEEDEEYLQMSSCFNTNDMLL